jgi:hypothetical protein
MEIVFDSAFERNFGVGIANGGSSAPTLTPYANNHHEDGDYGSSDED